MTATPPDRSEFPRNSPLDYQLGGPSKPAPGVGVVVRDRTARPAPGRWNVCYVNGFQTQPQEKALWRRHPGLVLRRGTAPVVDPGWPDEWLLDISTRAKRRAITRIMDRWIRGCARDGYDAVEFDNLDSWTRSRGLLKPRHAVAQARALVRSAHRHGLLAGQKNWAGWNGTRVGYDFAVVEQCGRCRECRGYLRDHAGRVLVIEYRRRDFRAACRAVGDRVAVEFRDLALRPHGPRAWC